ncbi:winged helix-turn-helix domain-containing protein [Vibrio harveyi]|uniref:winged helix-turn-helix domain-containing protein n=1 Tax=Vibrio harveyi TaxID=669 RepID=UPI003AAB6A66
MNRNEEYDTKHSEPNCRPDQNNNDLHSTLVSLVKNTGANINEIRILELLLANEGQVVPRDVILKECWKGRVVTDNSLNVAIKKLRDMLNHHGYKEIITTITKQGYMVNLEHSKTREPPPNYAKLCLYVVSIICTVVLLLLAEIILHNELCYLLS